MNNHEKFTHIMPRDKDLGKIVDEGDFIEIDLGLKAGHYQFRFTHKTAKPARNIKVLSDGDVVRIPNHNGKKSLFEGRNFFIIYKHLPDGGKERIAVDGFNRWLLFLKARTVTIDSFDIQHLIYKDNNDNHFISYMKDGDLHIDECNPNDYENKIIIQYPFN